MTAADNCDDLELLATGFARARTEGVFSVLAQMFAAALNASEVMVCEVSARTRARALAVWRDGASAPNYEYELAGTPCARARAGETLTLDLSTGQYRGYFGTPLMANDGAVLGHVCAYTKASLRFDARRRRLCEILAARAAAELRLVHVKRERTVLRTQIRQLRAEAAAAYDIDAIAGVSAAHRRLIEEVRRAAATDLNVLITGEPGTGKELMARAVHSTSARAERPFVRLDCTAIEMDFGAYGLAHRGTLFLDEPGALSLEMQARLMDVLEPRRDDDGVDVRLIAASTRDLRALIRTNAFREDLHKRLNVIAIGIPPLRARSDDVAALVQALVRKQSQRLGRRVAGIDPDSLAELTQYAWPGNIRELANLVERALLASDAPVLRISTAMLAPTAHDERAAIGATATAPARAPVDLPVDFDDTLSTGLHVVQREHILRILNATHWVIEGNSGAAIKLGMKPATLRHRMKKLGISRAQTPQAS